jgi:zinc and cadmium transporter
MTTWIYSLVSVTVVSLVALVGLLTLSLSEERIRRGALILVSFAVGTLLGGAFIHLIPRAFAGKSEPLGPSLLVLGGILIFFIVEKLLRHHHGPLHQYFHPEHEHDHDHGRPELAAINVIGDGVHNFIDGVLIGGSYLVSPELGLTTTVAVLFHEIPQEIGDFGVLVHSGLSVRKAILVNLASASVAVLGTLLALIAGSVTGDAITTVLVPVAAGGFVYIAAADLIPELHHERSRRGLIIQASFLVLGVTAMALLTFLE